MKFGVFACNFWSISGGMFLMKFRFGGLLFARKGVQGRFLRGLGAKHESRYHAPGRLGLHFGRHFSIKNQSKIDVNFDIIFWYRFSSIFDRFLEAFWIKHWSFLDNFSETVFLWKIAPRLYETIIFRGRRLQKSIKNRSGTGTENNIAFWIDFWWILDRF